MLKNERIAEMVRRFEGSGVNPYYAAYFECFNRELFYEAHDALEQLWLPIRKEPNSAFYKGLIQLAGAFVHLQKNRPAPSAALLKLARHNLAPFAPFHQQLDVRAVLDLIDDWAGKVANVETARNLLTTASAPKLTLHLAQ